MTKKTHILKKVSLGPPNVPTQNEPHPDDPRSAPRRGAQDLVYKPCISWGKHLTQYNDRVTKKVTRTLALQGVHCAQGTSMICMHWSSLSLGQSRPKDHCLSLTGAQTDLFEKVIIFHHFTYMWSEDKMCKTDRHTQKGARFCSDIFPLHTDRQISSSIREADLSKKCSFF